MILIGAGKNLTIKLQKGKDNILSLVRSEQKKF